MKAFVVARRLAAVLILAALWSERVAGDEQSAEPAAIAKWRAPDDESTQIRVPPTEAAAKKPPPITITFQFGEREQQLAANVVDPRPVTAETTVESVLNKAKGGVSIFRPAEGTISVIRPHTVVADDLSVKKVEETLTVVWDAKANRPTDETNFKLQPGDRILVKQPAPPRFNNKTAYASGAGMWTPKIPPPSDAEPIRAFSYAVMPMQPEGAPGAALPMLPPAVRPPGIDPLQPAARARQVLFKVQIFADPKGNMESFQPLRLKSGMIGDSESLLGAIRILENNSLIEYWSRPTIAGFMGQPNQISIHGADQSTEVEITPQETNGKLVVGLKATIRQGERVRSMQTTAGLDDAQTMIVKADTPQGAFVYIVLTPERVDALAPPEVQVMAPRAAPASRYTAPVKAPAPNQAPAIAQGMPAVAPAVAAAPTDAAFGAIQAAQFSAPNPIPIAAPPAPDRILKAGNRSQVRFDVAIVEDTSDSLAEIFPASPILPCISVDSQTFLATLRILEKHDLIKRLSSPRLVAAGGEEATLQVGQETPDKPQQFSQGLQIQLMGRELGGGLAVEFKLHQNERDRKLDMSMAMIVAHGQTIVMKGRWQPTPEAAAAAEAKTDDKGEKKAQYPVYVFVTPELVR
ncbi:MAG: hypothetical protein WD669_06825 [Pirellulales bacterium]